MHMQPETIVKDEETANNILLTCSVTYAYPTPNITWSIINPLLNTYALAQGNSSNYKLHCNGTIEIYHNFLSQRGFMVLTCTATNMHGSVEKKFYLWKHGIFANSKYNYLHVVFAMLQYPHILINALQHAQICRVPGFKVVVSS